MTNTQSNAPADGWLQDGGLLYRLTDDRRPENRDEIRVMLVEGSRSEDACARRAREVLDCTRATPAPVSAGEQEPAPDKWIFDPHDIEQGMMLNPAWLKLHGLSASQAVAEAPEVPPVQAQAAPSDADLEAMREAFDWDGWACAKAAQRAFARAVLARWGAPAAVSEPKLPSHEELADLIAQGLRGTWYCGRAWEAWHVGTMSKNDFSSVDESDTPEELADAVLALLAAAPQVETATTGAATVVVASAPVVATTAVSAPKANHLGELIGCFDAALSEGLQEALAETTDERLKDLVERRLMYGYWVAVGPDTGAAPQAPAGEGGASSLARKDPP